MGNNFFFVFVSFVRWFVCLFFAFCGNNIKFVLVFRSSVFFSLASIIQVIVLHFQIVIYFFTRQRKYSTKIRIINLNANCFLVSKIKSLRNPRKKITYLNVLKNLKGKCNGFQSHMPQKKYLEKKVCMYVFIINKNQTYKNNTLKGKYININYHISKQILYDNNNNNNNNNKLKIND